MNEKRFPLCTGCQVHNRLPIMSVSRACLTSARPESSFRNLGLSAPTSVNSNDHSRSDLAASSANSSCLPPTFLSTTARRIHRENAEHFENKLLTDSEFLIASDSTAGLHTGDLDRITSLRLRWTTPRGSTVSGTRRAPCTLALVCATKPSGRTHPRPSLLWAEHRSQVPPATCEAPVRANVNRALLQLLLPVARPDTKLPATANPGPPRSGRNQWSLFFASKNLHNNRAQIPRKTAQHRIAMPLKTQPKSRSGIAYESTVQPTVLRRPASLVTAACKDSEVP